jgi:hypothetical protein
MLEATLHRLIPVKVSTFSKLNHGEPYQFDRWQNDRFASPCLYYWFKSRDGIKRNTKRVPVSEIRAALCQLRNANVLSRETFKKVCPVAQSDGPCGFAVVGRIFEALGVAVYSGQNGFKLTDANEVAKLLEVKPT